MSDGDDANPDPNGDGHDGDGPEEADSTPTESESELESETTTETETTMDTDAGDDVDQRVAEFEARLDDVRAALDAAETESDLDDVEADLDDVETDVQEADLSGPVPETDTDEEEADEDDEPDPTEQLQEHVEDIRSDLEDQRGPYAEDVDDATSSSASTILSTRWAVEGEPEVRTAVAEFLRTAGDALGREFEADAPDLDDQAGSVEAVGAAALGEDTGAPLDPDADADTIDALLETVSTLDDDLEDATAWTDLEVVEQLSREGFYDRLTPANHRDFPPELNVVRIAEQEGDVDRILLAYENLDSDFIEERCVEAIKRLGDAEAFDAMHGQAKRRQVGPIEALGKMGDDRAVDTLVDFVDGNNVPVQLASLRALGEIGAENATQAIANVLVHERADVRSRAARALGLIGDTRAVDPLLARLDDVEEATEVRASAAWALVQIGTRRALEGTAEYADDRAYTVQVEAEKARDAVESGVPVA